jgi:hypothetical protein
VAVGEAVAVLEAEAALRSDESLLAACELCRFLLQRLEATSRYGSKG